MTPKPQRDEQWQEQPLEWLAARGHAGEIIAGVKRRQHSQAWRRRATAAAALALLIAVPTLVWQTRTSKPTARPAIATRVLAPELRILPDGSRVELNPDARIDVRFSSDRATREVVLTRGQAHFQVAHDPERPFVVRAGDVAFRAVGTAFAVDVDRENVVLLVTEGRVAVRTNNNAEPVAYADPHDRVTLAAGGGTTPVVTRVDSREEALLLAWRIPRLPLNETPLREVAELFKQHAAVTLKLGEGLGEIPISGVIPANDPEPLLEMLRRSYGVRITRVSPHEISIERGEK